MKLRGLLMVVAALLLGGVAVLLANSWLREQAARQASLVSSQPQVMTTTILVARTPLSLGHTIRSENVREVEWPAEVLPPGAFTSFEELMGDEEERVAIRSMSVNEPIVRDKVSGYGGRASLSAQLAPDMRAFTIRINDVTGVAGFVLPGDRVDVMLTRDPTPDNDVTDPITDMLLQNVRVLGVDQDANENRDQPVVVKAVTLEVSAGQAQKLTLGQQVGTLSLSLRNVTNVAETEAPTISLADLRKGEANVPDTPKPVVRRTADPGWNVRITRGLESQTVRVRREAPETTGRPVPLRSPPAPVRATDDRIPVADSGAPGQPQVAVRP